MASYGHGPSDCVSVTNSTDARGSESPARLCERAAVLFRDQQPEAALRLYAQVLKLEPRHPEALRGTAFAHRALGDLAQAEHATATALAADPHDYELIHLRSSLRRQTAGSDHVPALEQLLRDGIKGWRGAVHVGYALAKELEDLGRYEQAFFYLSAAARLKRSRTQYRPEADLALLEQIRTHYDARALMKRRSQGERSTAPIFIFGLPRTGSTLLERILSCHPEVHSCGEQDTFALELTRQVALANGGLVPAREALLARSLDLDFTALGRGYLQQLPRAAAARRFVDKLPLNSLYAGLIHLALPEATMIWLERDPMDTCYAMYKFLFSGAYPFSYDLTELGHYYRAHHALMEHWCTVIPPERLLRVRYETLVTEPERETRRLLAALGLPWDPACLAFETNPQPSVTGSAAQVRQPLYRSSIGAWRHYERQLAPLRAILKQ